MKQSRAEVSDVPFHGWVQLTLEDSRPPVPHPSDHLLHDYIANGSQS
jgi:hypothetical protein